MDEEELQEESTFRADDDDTELDDDLLDLPEDDLDGISFGGDKEKEEDDYDPENRFT